MILRTGLTILMVILLSPSLMEGCLYVNLCIATFSVLVSSPAKLENEVIPKSIVEYKVDFFDLRLFLVMIKSIIILLGT
jgi:hypothetical protein